MCEKTKNFQLSECPSCAVPHCASWELGSEQSGVPRARSPSRVRDVERAGREGHAARMATSNAPLVCHGHSRPINHLEYSRITDDGVFLISSSKGETRHPRPSSHPTFFRVVPEGRHPPPRHDPRV